MTKTVLLVVAIVTAVCTAVVLGLLLFAVGVLAAVLPFPATADGLPAPPPAIGQMVVVPAQLLPGTPSKGYPDEFPFGQCTYWVALRRRDTYGFPSRNFSLPKTTPSFRWQSHTGPAFDRGGNL